MSGARPEAVEALAEARRRLKVAALGGVKLERAEALLNALRAHFPHVKLQLLDAARVAGRVHLEFAAAHAVKAFRRGANISRSLEMELLLYASGQRQIKNAIETLGVKTSTRSVVVVAFDLDNASFERLTAKVCELTGGSPDPAALEEFSEEKGRVLMETYGIEASEVAAQRRPDVSLREVIGRLILERMALLEAER